MLSSVRRGSSALRSLRFISFPSTATAIRPLRTARAIPNTLPTITSISHFSTSRCFAEQALAEAPDATETPKEYTQFEELAQHGIISQTVIDTITKRMNIHTMTEVQRMTLNTCLDGTDVIAQAKTGTGKTLAFLLPIVQRILKDPALETSRGFRARSSIDIRALIVSPTRELAEQIAVEAQRLVAGTGIRVQTAVGGTQKGYHTRKMQQEGCHLLIGTPGRINDLLSDGRSGVSLENIQTFVLDEADRLLDIGFAPAIEEMQSHMPDRAEKDRQTLMFSATVPQTVVSLVRQTMRSDFRFVRTVDPNEAPTHERIPQKVVYCKALQNQYPAILEIATAAIEAHKQDPENNMPFKCIVYFGATTQVDMAFESFMNLRDPSGGRSNPLSPCRVYHMNGRMTQQQRTRETSSFRNAESAILFSTDVTARGMDFPNVSHVIQLGLPRQPDDYIHRLGRTGRAGKPGEGWLLLNEDEKRDFDRTFTRKGIQTTTTELESASLDMSRGAQLSPRVASLLRQVEIGVKSVSVRTKEDVYRSLLGVMQQQFPGRPKQDQIDMMNDLARYGWGMPTPPSLPRSLVEKLGYGRCTGIVYATSGHRRDEDFNRGGSSRGRRDSFSDRDPFGLGDGSGKGVFGANESFGEAGQPQRREYPARRERRGNAYESSSFGGRGRGFGRDNDRRGDRRGGGGGGGFGGDRQNDSFDGAF